MILENDDDNKVFNIAFRTPPADGTGVRIFWNTVFYVVPGSFR